MNDDADENNRSIINEMIGRFAAPSFIRRAKLVEATWSHLLERCAKARFEQLKFVGLRLGQLFALAGSWEVLRRCVRRDVDLIDLQTLHAVLQPRLLAPLAATSSRRALLGAGRELIEAMEMFNQRWSRWLAKIDLRAVNQARADYNRYYLFEKECVVGSAAIARVGYRTLEPVTLEEVAARWPLLRLPEFV